MAAQGTNTAVVLSWNDEKPGQTYLPLITKTSPIPTPSPNHLLIRLLAASLNHRDLFSRQKLYPGVAPDVPLLADGVGIVVAAGSENDRGWIGKRVLIYPAKGWESDPAAPEGGDFAILGGTKYYKNGTLQSFTTLPTSLVYACPPHLSTSEAAALPLCGLTAYRAVFTKGLITRGQNVLITGIGGGVALSALSFAHAAGATVFVTSSSTEKLQKAKEMGASAGVLYTEEGWEKKLRELLPEGRKWLDVVVDGAGGDLVKKITGLMKGGGRIVCYGMTLGPKIEYSMQAVLRNVDLLGSTMGSQKEFEEMVKFVYEKQIRPVVSKKVRGFEAVEELFEDMKAGRQFGKLVVSLADEEEVRKQLEGNSSRL